MFSCEFYETSKNLFLQNPAGGCFWTIQRPVNCVVNYADYADYLVNYAEVCHFFKKEILAQMFSCEFCEIFKNTIFTEHLWVTASANVYKYLKIKPFWLIRKI